MAETLYYAGFLVAAIVAGQLADVYGRRKVVAIRVRLRLQVVLLGSQRIRHEGATFTT